MAFISLFLDLKTYKKDIEMFIVSYKNKEYVFNDYLEAILFNRTNRGSILRGKNEEIRKNQRKN